MTKNTIEAKIGALRNRKGYIFTMSTFFLMTSILILALFFTSQVDKPSIAGPKVTSTYDDVRNDVFELLNMSVRYGTNDGISIVSFKERLPAARELKDIIKNYERFVEEKYTSRVEFELRGRKGSVSGVDVSMSLSNTSFEIVPHDYIYSYQDIKKEEIMFYPTENNSNLLGYFINLSCDQDITAVKGYFAPGNTPIQISANWPNREYRNSTTYNNLSYVNLSRMSYWILNVTVGGKNQSINITVGKTLIYGENKTGSIKVVFDGTMETTTTNMLYFPQTPYFLLESGFTITVEDIAGYYRSQNHLVDYTKIRDNMWFGGEFDNDLKNELDIVYPPPEQNTTEEGRLLGYCVCFGCYWTEFYEGDEPCELRRCPDEPGCIERDYMEFWPLP